MQTNIFKIIVKKQNNKHTQEPSSNKQQNYKGKAWKRDNSKREFVSN